MANKSIKEENYYKNFQKFLNEAYSEKQLAAELEKAFKAGPVETRKFLDGPMGQSPELRAMLTKASPNFDGSASDDTVKISAASGPCISFEPTQNYIDLMQSVAYNLGSSKTLTAGINQGPVAPDIVTSGNLIIDGHHRWSGAISIGGANATVSGKNVEWPGQNVKEKLSAAQLAIAATKPEAGPQPSKGGAAKTNILGQSADEISKLIMSNINKQTDSNAPGPLLNDKMMEDLLVGNDAKIVQQWLGELGNRVKWGSVTPEGIYQLRLAIAQKVGENLATLPQPK